MTAKYLRQNIWSPSDSDIEDSTLLVSLCSGTRCYVFTGEKQYSILPRNE